MSKTREAIAEILEQAPVIDVHCHLRPDKPAADSLADLVLYHHVWIELVSAGMPATEVTLAGLPHELADPGIPPLERVRRSLAHLPRIENTVSALLLRWLLQDLYGLDALTEENLEPAFALVETGAGNAHWWEEVLRHRCHIEYSVTVEHGGAPCSPAIQLGYEGLPINLRDGKRSPREVLESLDHLLGREVRTVADYRDLLARLIQSQAEDNPKFFAAWPLPYLTHEGAGDAEANAILEKARQEGAVSPAELGSFAYFGLAAALEAIRSTDIRTVQVIVGAEVLPPHRSLTHWSSGFAGAIGRLAGANGDFKFNLSSASDIYTQDLGILAKHVPNVSLAGYWWHTFYPGYIRKALETRLDMVPMNKIIGFFSDAYHAEWCYPKLKLVKIVLGDILAERVERGWYSLDLARRLAQRLLYENAKEIYAL